MAIRCSAIFCSGCNDDTNQYGSDPLVIAHFLVNGSLQGSSGEILRCDSMKLVNGDEGIRTAIEVQQCLGLESPSGEIGRGPSMKLANGIEGLAWLA